MYTYTLTEHETRIMEQTDEEADRMDAQLRHWATEQARAAGETRVELYAADSHGGYTVDAWRVEDEMAGRPTD